MMISLSERLLCLDRSQAQVLIVMLVPKHQPVSISWPITISLIYGSVLPRNPQEAASPQGLWRLIGVHRGCAQSGGIGCIRGASAPTETDSSGLATWCKAADIGGLSWRSWRTTPSEHFTIWVYKMPGLTPAVKICSQKTRWLATHIFLPVLHVTPTCHRDWETIIKSKGSNSVDMCHHDPAESHNHFNTIKKIAGFGVI